MEPSVATNGNAGVRAGVIDKLFTSNALRVLNSAPAIETAERARAALRAA